MDKKEKETQRKVAEALALIVTAQGRDDFSKTEADYYERLAKN